MRVGVLALQGDFQAHQFVLGRCGVANCAVRTAAELAQVEALVIPGGESSAVNRLMANEGLGDRICARIQERMAVLATCAGVILLAAAVRPEQPSLGVLDVDVTRNAYGRQIASDVVDVVVDASLGEPGHMEGVFIRAPRVTRIAASIEVLGRRADDPVLLRQDRIVAATFHPELSADLRVHRLFLQIVEGKDG